jgi:NADH-quinone oxidoreductase subunit E
VTMSPETTEEKVSLSAGICKEIDAWIEKYPEDQKQSAVMAALRIVQEGHGGGWLTTSAMNAVAEYLDMPPIAVYEVASFYSMYELKPVGKTKLCVCTNVSCMLNGSGQLVRHLEEKFNIKLGETTADGNYTLKEVECLGACGGAPVIQIDRQYYENLTPEIIDSILDKLE